jgi:hypothetical protein
MIPNLKHMNTQFNWLKVLIVSAIGLAMIAAFTFWQAQNAPLNSVDIDLALQGCTVQFAPNGEMTVIPFGDTRCPN